MRRLGPWWCGLLLLVAAPLVAAQAPEPGHPETQRDASDCLTETRRADTASCVVLYAHVPNDSLLSRLHLNVQRPPAMEEAYGLDGFGFEPLSDMNQMTLRAAPGFAQYDGEGLWIYDDKRVGSDFVVPVALPIRSYWYFSIDPVQVSGFPFGLGAGVAPCVVVHVIVEKVDEDETVTILAQGRTTRSIVTAPALPRVPEAPCTGAPFIEAGPATEFAVELTPTVPEIRVQQNESFVVRVEWYQVAPEGPDGGAKVYPLGMRLNAGPVSINRVVVPVEHAVRIERLEVAQHGDEGMVRVAVMSPWGNYDVDPTSLRVALYRDDGDIMPLRHLGGTGLFSTHDHQEPLQFLLPWDVGAEQLPPGTYQLEASAHNWQHTAKGRLAVPFHVTESGNFWAEGSAAAAPGPTPGSSAAASSWLASAAVAGAAVAALLWVARRSGG